MVRAPGGHPSRKGTADRAVKGRRVADCMDSSGEGRVRGRPLFQPSMMAQAVNRVN